jgi:hypothetical protein
VRNAPPGVGFLAGEVRPVIAFGRRGAVATDEEADVADRTKPRDVVQCDDSAPGRFKATPNHTVGLLVVAEREPA